MNHADVLVGILHTETVSITWAFGLRNLQIPGRGAILPVAGQPFDMGRNTIAQAALDGGFSHLFFLDSDVCTPRDVIPRLLAHNKPIVSGVYCRRSPPHGVPVMMRNLQWVTRYPANSLIEVDVVGAGCLLISTELLRKLPPSDPKRGKHWFDWRVDLPKEIAPKGEGLSEDFTFNHNCKKFLGVPTLVDTSIQCLHIGAAAASYNTFLPCVATANPV